jgi:F plasmid transfer operon, TraF, protein
MRRIVVPLAIAALLVVIGPVDSMAQTFEVIGTRAAGMGGAFVAVADDASAVYWNPAGLALGGALFGLVADTSRSESDPKDGQNGGKQSGTLLALTTPPLGLSYYRLSATRVSASGAQIGTPPLAFEKLTTHHAGVTLIQSLTPAIAVASTLKAVRGSASSAVVLDGDRDALLDGDDVVPTRATTRFSADVGVLARLGATRIGVTVRNVTEPDFDTADGGAIELKRQSRAGIAYLGVQGVIVAADVDLERATLRLAPSCSCIRARPFAAACASTR